MGRDRVRQLLATLSLGVAVVACGQGEQDVTPPSLTQPSPIVTAQVEARADSPTPVIEAPSELPTSTPVPTTSRVLNTPTPDAGAVTVSNAQGEESPEPIVPANAIGERLRGPSSVPPSSPYEPLPLVVDQALEQQIRAYLGDEISSYGIVVKQLGDGSGVAINPDRQYYAASLFKLFVMYEVYKQRDLGLLSFDEKLTFTTPYQAYQIGDPLWPLGSEISIRDLLEVMITVSDNVAAMLLHDKTGGWNINQDLQALGLKSSAIGADVMPTTASDTAKFLEMLARGMAVDEQSSQEMIELLGRQQINDRLPALLPAGTMVAHKTGNWDDVTHDVGIVYGASGPYVISVLSDVAWQSQPIAEISKLVYEHFNGKLPEQDDDG